VRQLNYPAAEKRARGESRIFSHCEMAKIDLDIYSFLISYEKLTQINEC
jgi:hypothetical protein